MHFSPLLSIFLLTPLINAQPTIQVPLQDEDVYNDGFHDKSCTIKLPSSYQQISRVSPQKSFPQNNIFNVTQATGGKDNTDTLLRFSGIPTGSYGCQLAVSFTFDYPIYSIGSTQLNVYALPRPISPSDTYSTYFPNGGRGIPKDSYLFATTTITGQKAVLNSQVCQPSLGYLFEIASETAAGSVTFADAGNNLSGIGGFYLTYNC
ncbi:hypothetical protein MMC29_007024 [Sticta canariensis]|nr:hypothetical protein [Sticta canariensis]